MGSNMHMLIAAIELQLQSLLKQTINQPNSNTMEKATSILMSNDEILFHWSLTSAACMGGRLRTSTLPYDCGFMDNNAWLLFHEFLG